MVTAASLRPGELRVAERVHGLRHDRYLKDGAFQRGQRCAVNSNRGHIHFGVGIDEFIVDSVFPALKPLFLVDGHVGNHMTAGKNVKRVDDKPGSGDRIARFVRPGDV